MERTSSILLRLAGGLMVGLIIGFTAAWMGVAAYQIATGNHVMHPFLPERGPFLPHRPFPGP
jgi:hypothetical protein